MLPNKRRIRKTEFSELLSKGAFGASPLFTIRFISSKKDEKSTFAVVVSKKVASSAVARNKIKRNCYHVLRDLSPKVKNSYKIIFFVKKGVEKLSFKDLSSEIHSALARNRLID